MDAYSIARMRRVFDKRVGKALDTAENEALAVIESGRGTAAEREVIRQATARTNWQWATQTATIAGAAAMTIAVIFADESRLVSGSMFAAGIGSAVTIKAAGKTPDTVQQTRLHDTAWLIEAMRIAGGALYFAVA